MKRRQKERYKPVHTPVLLDSVLSLLKQESIDSQAEFLFVDATLGEGGHAEALLLHYPGMMLYGVDADGEVLLRAQERLKLYKGRIRLFNEWFTDFFKNFRQRFKIRPSGILFDLGISMFHYEKSGRGFSFRKDEPLDMRIGKNIEQTAEDIINTYSQNELFELIKGYGEERMAKRITYAIIKERRAEPITKAHDLAGIIWKAVPPSYRYGSIHPATKTFQALRIAVNNELSRLKEGLREAFQVLEIGGRLGVISFHSLEDRIVKHFFKERNKSCTCPPDWPICQCERQRELKILTKKPLTASTDEIKRNPKARSAKLRVVEKLIA